MGVYLEGALKNEVAGKAVQGHIFEYTSQVVVSQSGDVGFGSVPIQLLYCLKEKNAKKLNSHRWFFNAFGPVLRPNVCILLDVGTVPTDTSLYELFKCFSRNPYCGGACGEIKVDLGRWGKKLLNPLVASQNFEYKMSNILDKSFESAFGLIAVLPGAFSAYWYAAVANFPDGTGPLQSYFRGEAMHSGLGAKASIADQNAWLAEDRILAFEVVCRKGSRWTLKYVKQAKAITDAPEDVATFISQRRRWLNGSTFAALNAVTHFYRVWTSGHGFIRKIFLTFLSLYNLINLIFQWFSLSSFYLAFFFIGSSTTSGSNDPFFGQGPLIFEIFNKVYIAMLFVVIICALGNRPAGSKWMFTTCFLVFAVCQGILLYSVGFTIYTTVPKTSAEWEDFGSLWNNETLRSLGLSFAATYGLYLISSIIFMTPWHMLTSFAQYLFLLPSYINVLWLFSICNIHDVTWGTRKEETSYDIGAAKKVDKEGVVEVAVPSVREDLDDLWTQARAELRTPAVEIHEKRSPEVKQNDSNRNFRTNVVLLNLGTNMAIILLFTSAAFTTWISSHFSTATTSSFNPYLAFLFWAVLGLSAVRFVGAMSYLLMNAFGH